MEKDKIVFWGRGVRETAYVRYGFGNTIIGNVFSKEGLPLPPFGTDNFLVDQSAAK